MLHSRARRTLRIAIALALGSAPLLAVGTAAAAEQPVRLSVKPVGSPGSYFKLTLKPGETRQLRVQLANHSNNEMRTRTYAAEVYTIINGGFGAKLAAERSGGTTNWLDYPSDIVILRARSGVQRSFTVNIPRGTEPGEYLASVVIENAAPVKGTGSVALNQIIRTAIAVAIRVPGRLKGRLNIGAATHKFASGNSVVAVSVSNTGNRLLKPLASFAVEDSNGNIVTASTVQMDSFYAGTATAVELPLAAALAPGAYTVSLTLRDRARRTTVHATALPVNVDKPASAKDADGSSGRLAGVLQDVPGGLPVLPIGCAVAALVLVAGSQVLVRQRRRHTGAGPAPATQTAPSPVALASRVTAPERPTVPMLATVAELAPAPAGAPVEHPACALLSAYTVRDILPK